MTLAEWALLALSVPSIAVGTFGLALACADGDRGMALAVAALSFAVVGWNAL